MSDDFYIRGIRRTDKPWGYYETLFTSSAHGVRNAGNPFKVKVLYIEKGHRISLQKHENRREIWTVIEGNPIVRKGSIDFILSPGETVVIEKGQTHRIEADLDDVLISELQLGVCEEDDIERLHDDYDRRTSGGVA
jgi:mannose-6-phosphate isomerase-like protein (cupin superfamily)|tara:strand:+ start:57 stop:464 length:408 start_codon:yes stop_codon:yes gene_type:complete